MRQAVRPTLRALADLHIPLPSADIMLHVVDHPDIEKSQSIPESVVAGGAESIRCVTDHRWYKYKRAQTRGAVIDTRDDDIQVGDAAIGRWWLGAAGIRQDDSGQHDFYQAFARETISGSGHLLPTDRDTKRIQLELAARAVSQIRWAVLNAIVASTRSCRPARAEARDHYIQAQVNPESPDEVYLLIGACGVYDSSIVAIMLDSVPGVQHGDWIAEPDPEGFGAKIEAGEVVYSTIVTSETLQHVIGLVEGYE